MSQKENKLMKSNWVLQILWISFGILMPIFKLLGIIDWNWWIVSSFILFPIYLIIVGVVLTGIGSFLTDFSVSFKKSYKEKLDARKKKEVKDTYSEMSWMDKDDNDKTKH